MSQGAQPAAPNQGGALDPDLVRLPDPAAMFLRRAERFAALTDGNPLGPYLAFLAGIARAQHEAAAEPSLFGEGAAQRPASSGPPLAKRHLHDGFLATLATLLRHLPAGGEVPEAAEAARQRLAAAPEADRVALAESVFDGLYPVERLGEALYAAAAVQVHLARLAATLDPASVRPPADGTCPVCGGAPAASMVVGWAKADRARYCCCGLCGTLWNYVRIKCTACGSTAEIGYVQIEGRSQDVAAETCGACRSYIKHLHQHRDRSIEPLADDVASYGLDLLVQQDGFRRAGLNPLMVIAEEPAG